VEPGFHRELAGRDIGNATGRAAAEWMATATAVAAAALACAWGGRRALAARPADVLRGE
jgi:hypothetical protein